MEVFTEKLMLRFGDKHGTMVVRVFQPATARATVFGVHGFEGNGGDFDYLARFLAQKGFRVVCPDMIGRGASTYFGDHAMYAIDSYFTCLGALSKYAGETNYFIGTSWGGAIVLYFLAVTRIKADKLVLNDVGLRNNPTVDEAIKFMAEDSRREFDTLAEAQAYVRTSRQYLGQFPEELWPRYLENKIRVSDGKFRLAYDPATTGRTAVAIEKQYNLFPLLEKIDTQILLLYGVDSKCYHPEVLADVMRRCPRISCIPDLRSGHPPSLMTYEQALMIGGFLAA
jgi:pimeloyl-ACP methyl ester carboxylesterase